MIALIISQKAHKLAHCDAIGEMQSLYCREEEEIGQREVKGLKAGKPAKKFDKRSYIRDIDR